MVNAHRGEAEIEIEGQTYTGCLTLGALAEIETALGVESVEDMGPRLQKPGFNDLLVMLAALLRGGGHDLSDQEVGRLQVDLQDLTTLVQDCFERSGFMRQGKQAAPKGRPRQRPGGATSKSGSASSA